MGEQVGARLSWGCSSVGRAPALQAGGQEFESLHLHLPSLTIAHGGILMSMYLENCISETHQTVNHRKEKIYRFQKKSKK